MAQLRADSRNKTLLRVFGKHSCDHRTGRVRRCMEPHRKTRLTLFDTHSSDAIAADDSTAELCAQRQSLETP